MTRWTGADGCTERRNSGSRSPATRMERRQMTAWVTCTRVSRNIGIISVLWGICGLILSWFLYTAFGCGMTSIQVRVLKVWKSLTHQVRNSSYCWEVTGVVRCEWKETSSTVIYCFGYLCFPQQVLKCDRRWSGRSEGAALLWGTRDGPPRNCVCWMVPRTISVLTVVFQ